MKQRYRISEVSVLTGIALHRLEYAVAKKQVRINRPDRRYARHWYTPEEIRGICIWFGVDVPRHLECVPAP